MSFVYDPEGKARSGSFRLDSVLEGLRPGRESLQLGECLQGTVHHHHKKYVPARLNFCIA